MVCLLECVESSEQANNLGMSFVALTGWGSSEEQARTSAAGFHEHLMQPSGITLSTPW